MSNKEIVIDKRTYTIIDAKERMTVADSWLFKNKIGTGNGEAKFYIGQDNKQLWDFFDDFSRKCFFLKSDILKYLEEVKEEYENPEQPYRNAKDLGKNWKEYYKEIQNIEDEIIKFNLQQESQITLPRIYVKSKDKIYKFIRKISLPNITYLSALKIKSSNGEIFYYFRLFVDYSGEKRKNKEVVEKIQESEKLSKKQKDTLVKARKGQGKYRAGVLAECPYCPITMVSDDRLLIASHIKPWVKSDEREKIDPKNGFMFTPTYDFLFDRGFVTFTDDQKMVVSPWLSKMTCSKLSLVDGKKYPLLLVDGKEVYLEYHRKQIFKS